jgi:hypothetical protein
MRTILVTPIGQGQIHSIRCFGDFREGREKVQIQIMDRANLIRMEQRLSLVDDLQVVGSSGFDIDPKSFLKDPDRFIRWVPFEVKPSHKCG